MRVLLSASTQTAASRLSLLLLCCICGWTCTAQEVDKDVCTQTMGGERLPAIPDSFHLTMSSAISPGNKVGHVTIMADANISRAAVINEVASDGQEFKAIFDSVTNQILLIDRRADPYDIENCQVLNVSAGSYSAMMRLSFLGKEWITPTGKFFTAPGLSIIRSSPVTINGVAATPYRTCYYASDLQGTLEITWWYPSGASSPMQAKTRFRKAGDTGAVSEVIYSISPLRSMSGAYDATRHQFTAPRAVYCKGLVSAKKAPNTFDRFSVGAERFVYNLPGVADIADYLRESYDRRSNLTMLEGALSFTLDKSRYGPGVLARINDFTRGISYVKNLRFGNCTYEKIPEGDWDSDPDPNGAKIKTPDEFFFPGLDQLQYKGSGIYRQTNVDIYAGYKDNFLDPGDGRKYPLAAEYYLQSKVTYDGAGNPVYRSVPIAVFSAAPTKFNSQAELFDFFTGVPRAFDHDISDCFSATQKQHFELILSTSDLDASYVKYLSDYPNEFLYSIVTSLSKAINISPLRIIQPEVSLLAPPLILVEITISDRANVPDYTPKIPEIPLSQVAGAMSDKVNNDGLFIDVMEGDQVFQVKVDGFVSMDARGSDSSPSGMSVGAAVGLSFGMILLGALLALGVLFAVNYFRNGQSMSSPFGFAPFGGQQQDAAA